VVMGPVRVRILLVVVGTGVVLVVRAVAGRLGVGRLGVDTLAELRLVGVPRRVA
jgi:hypothetical protein